jgi:hypothetical protein
MRFQSIGLLVMIMLTTADAAAKHPTRYGYEKGFWTGHRLVVGTIKRVEARGNQELFVDIIVDESVPASSYPGEVLEARYVVPEYEKEGSVITDARQGGRVLAIIEPQWGRAVIPNGDGEYFAMMPTGKPIYWLIEAGDPVAEETMKLCTALTVDPIKDKLVAISVFLERKPSARARAFLSQYLETLIAQLSNGLDIAKALANAVKHQ